MSNIGKTATSRDWHNDFDIDAPEYGDVFHSVADDLVANCPVAHSKDGYYIVSRRNDILKILQNWETFSSADGHNWGGSTARPALLQAK